jgi:3',5'-cyclic AMP phosphodiesterase CpdA
MARIVQISDTHFSRTKPHFMVNLRPLQDWVRQQHADLVVHTGDVTVDGADSEDDMRDVADMMRSLGTPFLALPGNHDVGEAGNRHQPVNDERLARWRRHFGPDWWSRDIEGWRLVGIDSMLFGSGHPDEARQMAWLHEVVAAAAPRRIAWFTHRPLFIEHPEEGDRGYWSVEPAARKPLLDLIRERHVALVATGHLHKWHDATIDGCRYIWGPSAGFLVDQDQPERLAGEQWMGAALYELHGADLNVRHAPIPGLTELWISDVIHEVYPHSQAAA